LYSSLAVVIFAALFLVDKRNQGDPNLEARVTELEREVARLRSGASEYDVNEDVRSKALKSLLQS